MNKSNSTDVVLTKNFSSSIENSSLNLNINLVEDLNNISKDFLKKEKINSKHIDDPYLDVCIYNLQVVEAKPRQIKKSKSFNCPKGYENKLNFVENAITNGDSLKPFFTKRISNLNNPDYLLYDWGVYHLHLNDTFEKNGMLDRSDMLILSFITDNAVYMLDIFPHQQEHLWENKKILEIISDNWPELIKHYFLKGIKCLALNLNEYETKMFRNSNINTITELSKDFVLAPGGGYTTDGTPMKALMKRDKNVILLRNMENFLKSMIPNLINNYPNIKISNNKDITIRLLKFDDNIKLLKIENSNIYIRMEIKNNNWNYILLKHDDIAKLLN